MGHFFKRWFILMILLMSLMVYLYYNFGHYLTFSSLKQHREMLLAWKDENYFSTVAIFMVIYIIAVSISIPGATFLTVAGGFLFGIYWGTVYVVLSATIGATCVFIAVHLALEPWIAKKTNKWVAKMRKGFQQGAMQYLLMLRLIPLFPFWVVNIVSALLGVRIVIFILATLIGIIPGSFVYVLLGNGLGQMFDQNQTPNMGIIFEPQVLIPLIALAFLSSIPGIYKLIKRRSV